VCINFRVLLLLLAIHSELIVKPGNKSVVVGDNTWLNCTTNLTTPVDWNIRYPNNTKILVYTLGEINNKFLPRFSVSSAVNGRYDLLIRDTQLADEGTYECKDNAGLGKSATTYLLVREIAVQLSTGTILGLHCLKSCLSIVHTSCMTVNRLCFQWHCEGWTDCFIQPSLVRSTPSQEVFPCDLGYEI